MATKRRHYGKESKDVSRPKLRKYDPSFCQSVIKPREQPSNWSFFSSPDSYMIDDTIHARMEWNAFNKCYMCHFGRQTKNGKVSSVCFSTYEAYSVIDFLEDILDQIKAMGAKDPRSIELIPYFSKNEKRAFEHEGCKDWHAFWLESDIVLPSIQIRLGKNRLTGSYILIINAPVSQEIPKNIANWAGPQQVFLQDSMKMLLEFLKSVVKRAMYELAACNN